MFGANKTMLITKRTVHENMAMAALCFEAVLDLGVEGAMNSSSILAEKTPGFSLKVKNK